MLIITYVCTYGSNGTYIYIHTYLNFNFVDVLNPQNGINSFITSTNKYDYACTVHIHVINLLFKDTGMDNIKCLCVLIRSH